MKLDLLTAIRLGGTCHALLLCVLMLVAARASWEGPPQSDLWALFFVACAGLCLAVLPPMWMGTKDGKPAA